MFTDPAEKIKTGQELDRITGQIFLILKPKLLVNQIFFCKNN